jgi:outer membrane protein assembly factor BamB
LEEFNIKSEYQFKNKVIKYNQRSKLECYDSSSTLQIWEQKIKGYIYTQIEQKEKLIFFGTAVKGGAFYCISLDKGEKLAEYNNGDASEFSWFIENIIIRDKKGNLAKINAKNGETIEELKLKNKISYYAPILVDGNKTYVRVFDKKENKPKLICVEL